jgi:hypothetical protein
MKTLKASRGPFIERPYYTDQEIETICGDELRATELLPSQPGPVRIDRFIEKRFSVVPTYEDLGDGILGLTRFDSEGVSEIVVSRSLEDENTQAAERRIRTTLAHEAGHGLLHGHLFVLSPQTLLFGDSSDAAGPKVLCRNELTNAGFSAYKGEWWEFQANRAIGALLLPRSLVEVALKSMIILNGKLGLKAFDRSKYETAARHLADLFNVNPIVARIRIDQVFPETKGAQLSL